MIHLAQSLHFIDWALWPKKGSNLQLPSEQGSTWLLPVLFPRHPHSCNGRTTSDSKKSAPKKLAQRQKLTQALTLIPTTQQTQARGWGGHEQVFQQQSDWCIHVALSVLQPGLCAFLAFWNLLLELVSFPPSILEANLHPLRTVCLLAIALDSFRAEWGGPSR